MRRANRWPLALVGLAVLAGCQSGARPLADDPLIGGTPTSRPGFPRRDEAPPVPPASSSTSPAALTLGAAIPERKAAIEGVTLGGPRPKAAAAAPVPAETTSRTATPPSGDSYETLQRKLQERGVVWQQLKMVENDRWDYSCAIPAPNTPSVRRTYEARSRGSAVEAMREVLAEIDAERR